MQNFEFEHNGQKLWYSRSLACNVIIMRKNENNDLEVLACKRGQGCEFNKGKWNVPGGFIDFNEDAITCALRELKEETGLTIPKDRVKFFSLNTTPNGKRQTMVACHYALFDISETLDWEFSYEFSEPDETEETKWIPINELNQYTWCNGQLSNIHAVRFHIESELAGTPF